MIIQIQLKHKIGQLFLNRKRNYLILTQSSNAIIGLISGKLIAEFILPEKFGLYNLQFAVYTFFFTLFVGPSVQFLKSTYYGFLKKVGLKYYINTIILFSVLTFFVVFSFFNLYKPINQGGQVLFIIILFYLICNTTTKLLADQFNVLDNINKFSTHSIVSSGSGLIFLILAFYGFRGFEKNSNTLWLMQLIMALIGVGLFFKYFKVFVKDKPLVTYHAFLVKHFRFTLPLMFLAIWTWVNNYFDRFVIEHYMQLKDVGIYNANYGVGSKFFLLLNPIFLVLLTPLVYQKNTINFKKKTIKRYVKVYSLIAVPILTIVWLSKNHIGNILLSDFYREGFYLIFWVCVAYFIITATYLYESLIYVELKTNYILYGNILGAIVNVVLNIILIPIIGLNGAIFATIASAIIRFLFIYSKFSKL